MSGHLHLFNTVETFRAQNFKALLVDVGQRIFVAIQSGEALKDPQLLNQFLAVAYAVRLVELKTPFSRDFSAGSQKV